MNKINTIENIIFIGFAHVFLLLIMSIFYKFNVEVAVPIVFLFSQIQIIFLQKSEKE